MIGCVGTFVTPWQCVREFKYLHIFCNSSALFLYHSRFGIRNQWLTCIYPQESLPNIFHCPLPHSWHQSCLSPVWTGSICGHVPIGLFCAVMAYKYTSQDFWLVSCWTRYLLVVTHTQPLVPLLWHTYSWLRVKMYTIGWYLTICCLCPFEFIYIYIYMSVDIEVIHLCGHERCPQ